VFEGSKSGFWKMKGRYLCDGISNVLVMDIQRYGVDTGLTAIDKSDAELRSCGGFVFGF